MSVQWSWKEKLGSLTVKGRRNEEIKLNIYRGNCLCVIIYDYKENGKDMYQFYTFFNDINHLKRCIGLMKNYNGEFNNLFKDEWILFELDPQFKENKTLGKYLVQAGYSVLFKKEVK